MKELILLTVSFFQTLLNVFIFMGHLSGYFPTQDFLENLEASLKALFALHLTITKVCVNSSYRNFWQAHHEFVVAEASHKILRFKSCFHERIVYSKRRKQSCLQELEPANWRVMVSGELRFKTSYLES